MKAVRVEELGGPEVLKLCEMPALAPSPGEVLVHVSAAGVNPVETYIRAGAQGYQPSLPYTPGTDGAGIVASVGPGVVGITAGQRVYVYGSITGTYAEMCLCTQAQVFALTDTLSFAQGAGLGIPYTTAYRALFQRTKTVMGERVLVHGASGGVGLAAVQLAVASKIDVIGTAGTDEGCRMVVKAGAVAAVNHSSQGYVDHLLDLTEGRGYDVILEMLANVNLSEDLRLLGKFGRIVIVGSRGTVEINPREMMVRDASVMGMSVMNASEGEKRAVHDALAPLLEIGSVAPVIQVELPLTSAAEAHRMVIERPSLGKIVLMPST